MLSAGLWWGSVLALVAALALLAFMGSLVSVPQLAASGTGELRFLPVLLSIAGVGLLVLGLTDAQIDGWLNFTSLGVAVAGVALLTFLGAIEARRRDALVDVRLFASSSFTVSVLALSVAALVTFGAMYLLTFYLQVAREYTPLQAGLLFLPMSVGLVAGAPISRRLVVRFGTGPTITIGLSLIASSMMAVSTYTMATSIAVVLAGFLVLVLGFSLVLSPGTTAAMESVPQARVGAGSALLNTARQVASALGVAILGSILWSVYGSHIAPTLNGLPRQARQTARQSLGGALTVVDAEEGITAAREAFIAALHVTALVAGCTALVCATVVGMTAWHSARAIKATHV